MTKPELTDWSDWFPEVNLKNLRPEDFAKPIIEPPYFPVSLTTQDPNNDED